MSPRSRYITGFILVLAAVFTTAPAIAGDPEIPDQKNMFIRFYQDHISAADGNRCPMTPSCSEYAARAIEKHGPIIGWIMASDRLIRCGRDEVKISPSVRINGMDYTADPVSANDFWWFTRDDTNEAEISKDNP